MTYVIIGAGPSGVTAAETLRKVDPVGEIILLGGEPEPPYSRMAIPYLLTGQIDEAGTYLRKRDGHYEANRIEYRQATVESVDPAAKSLTLADGTTQAYDKLLVATGASPVKPPIDGLDLPGVHHCWTLADARHIIALAGKGAEVVLMGAGFIGCIILESLVERGVKLTVVEALDRMVPRMMNAPAGNMIKNWCTEKGVRVLTSTKVTRLAQSDGRLAVELDSGEQTAADLVVVATGVRSNVDFLEGSGVKTDTGIVVDQNMRSTVEDIYAAGDCAQGLDFSTGGWEVHAIQPTAVDHGRIAALNMAGRPTPFNGSLNMNVLDTAGLISVSFGRWDGVEGGDHAESVDADNYRYTRLEFDGDRIVGALALGRTDHVGVLRGLIQTGIHLGPWKEKLMADPNRIVEAYIDRTQGA
ncbi:MAG: NAD(P)/FAD-dependent oxidoreductase [Rhodospirillales bacterium]|nr:MAG: NAD(P)/FAD-dependent oxidoreductase [Rhodospirillales bacterium]